MKLKDVFLSNDCVLIDFKSDDCPPCKLIEQELAKVKLELGDKLAIFQVDQEREMDIFKAFNIQSIPHLKLFKSGRPIWSYSGLISGNDIIVEINKCK